MLHTLILTIHILACIFLIVAVLLQAGKGADIGAVFGGAGSQALFGSSGPVDFLNKGTRVLVVVFMITSFTLGFFALHRTTSSIMSSRSVPGQTIPVAPGAPPASKAPSTPVLPVTPAPAVPALPVK
ncbi:MAG: preprotein translocase subunit SecG [Desulfomonilia bacterium]|jgi:preprotein translocase subunit SecG